MTSELIVQQPGSSRLAHIFAFARFGVVGVITAAIYFGAMWIANSGLHLHYVLAVTIAYIFSTMFHFLANRHFTFNAVEGKHTHQLARYLVMWCVNYAITIVVVRFCVEQIRLSPYLGVCVSVVFTVITGFFISRYWVFKTESHQ